MASNDHKSAADIEREVEMQRHRVSDTIDELQTRLSPGQLVDQVMSYSKGGAGEMAQNLGRAVMDNPIPAALLGVSLFWLMTGRNPASGLMNGHHHESRVSPDAARYHPPYYDNGESYGEEHEGFGDKLKSAAGGARDFASGVTHKARDAAHAAGELGSNVRHKVSDAAAAAGDAIGHAKDALHGASEQVQGGASRAGHAIGGGYNQARGAVGSGYGSARGALDDGYEALGSGFNDARDRVSGMAGSLSRRAHDVRYQASMMQENTMAFLSEQPLVAAALAFAAGAALGATLPVTRKENELMGEASDQVKAGLRDAAQPLMDRAQEVMGDVVSEGQSVLGEVVEEGRHVVDDAMKEGKSALDHAQSKLGESYGHMKDTVTDSVDKTLKTAADKAKSGANEAEKKLAGAGGSTSSQQSSSKTSSGVAPTSDWPVGSSGTAPGSTT